MQPLSLFGPVDAVLEPIIGYLVLVLLLVNVATRLYAHRQAVEVSRDPEADEDDVSHPLIHVAANLLLLLATFYYLTFHHHSGIVLSTLVVGLFLTEYFEFDAELVQVREGRDVESPKASLTAAFVTFLYIAYLTMFVYIKPFWNEIV